MVAGEILAENTPVTTSMPLSKAQKPSEAPSAKGIARLSLHIPLPPDSGLCLSYQFPMNPQEHAKPGLIREQITSMRPLRKVQSQAGFDKFHDLRDILRWNVSPRRRVGFQGFPSAPLIDLP